MFGITFRIGVSAAFLAAATSGMACPPASPQMKAEYQQRLKAFKDQARKSAIVYGVLESDLGFDYNDPTSDPERIATLEILHVYQGDFQKGQRVKVRPGVWPLVPCAVPPLSLPKGAYGIIVLEKASAAGFYWHNGFLPKNFEQMFLDEKIIQSAQAH